MRVRFLLSEDTIIIFLSLNQSESTFVSTIMSQCSWNAFVTFRNPLYFLNPRAILSQLITQLFANRNSSTAIAECNFGWIVSELATIVTVANYLLIVNLGE